MYNSILSEKKLDYLGFFDLMLHTLFMMIADFKSMMQGNILRDDKSAKNSRIPVPGLKKISLMKLTGA